MAGLSSISIQFIHVVIFVCNRLIKSKINTDKRNLFNFVFLILNGHVW
jgi:hypothetical protein